MCVPTCLCTHDVLKSFAPRDRREGMLDIFGLHGGGLGIACLYYTIVVVVVVVVVVPTREVYLYAVYRPYIIMTATKSIGRFTKPFYCENIRTLRYVSQTRRDVVFASTREYKRGRQCAKINNRKEEIRRNCQKCILILIYFRKNLIQLVLEREKNVFTLF